jgi:phosphonate transport system permease protein
MSVPANIKSGLFSGNSRKITALVMLFLFLFCAWSLGPMATQTPSQSDGFLSAAFHPTLTDQNQSLPDDATPFYTRILMQMANTVRYAMIAMSLAVPAGMILGFFASTAWWPQGAGSQTARLLLRPIHLSVRLLITLMRSIHELIWAIFFLAAIGDEPITACVAIALPFAGTLAKVFSEITDELPRQAQDQAIASGTSSIQAYLTTLIPQSAPDMATYTLYRFECALRSSAVLGFIGIETIGLSIQKSFENNFYNELWTQLYLLIGVIMLVDILGSQLRKRLNNIPSRKQDISERRPTTSIKKYIRQIKRHAPRWRMTRVIFWTTATCTLIAWFPSLLHIETTSLINNSSSIDRGDRVMHFLEKITPAPARESGAWSDAVPWATELWTNPGKEALFNTLTIATSAIILAAFAAWFLLPWANRALAHARPLHVFHGRESLVRNTLWKLGGLITRTFFLISRSIPEYIIAYLLIGLLGISAWPLVLALALHNFGILGRLWGEVIENQPPAATRQIMLGGATRLQCYLNSYLPESFNRLMLYLFYRWETCVREATILGMLGGISLGYHIKIARNFSRAYDEMFFYVLLGAAVIFIGDTLSFFLRRSLMRS